MAKGCKTYHVVRSGEALGVLDDGEQRKQSASTLGVVELRFEEGISPEDLRDALALIAHLFTK